MNIETVNELIQSLESAGELSIKETKVMALAKAYQQLAAENVGLKRVPETDSVAMLLALDSFRSESLPDVGLQKAFESLMYHRKTPATDAYLAGLKADAAAPLVSALKVIANSEQHNGDTVVCDFDTLISVAACALRDYYAKQLRAGTDK
ncbi:hypothetical protein ACYA8F_22830 [Klebsiella pneumoniae]|uniref:hypothetical protein n=1 Tax=Klebsiella pneumoniae TaxID=573 RepID=UPI001CC0B235|nr:hypothetical protein [Klebsiella pneumoniae]MBZ1746766.1 hypothetical protein [Klebsiella pneumoniae]WLX58914.1 hypothetical protein RA195_06440 [Klebsiella pneumoniae]